MVVTLGLLYTCIFGGSYGTISPPFATVLEDAGAVGVPGAGASGEPVAVAGVGAGMLCAVCLGGCLP